MSKDEELRIKAKKRVEQKIGFYWNFGAYVPVNIMLFFMWFFLGQRMVANMPWFIFPLIFWGIAVLAHFLITFVIEGPSTERMVENEYEKMKKERT
jgi:uncharacterized protein (DUF486 family)